MPNSAETIERLAKIVAWHTVLEEAQDCETLQELVEKVKAILKAAEKV